MTQDDSIEVEAATVDEAIREALDKLGADEDDVAIEILSTPRSGLLGLGARSAKVRVKRRPPEGAQSQVSSPGRPKPQKPQPSAETRTDQTRTNDQSDDTGDQAPRQSADLQVQGREAVSLLNQILVLMGEKANVEVTEASAEAIEVEIKGDGSGILIGRHGQTLDALEYLLNRLIARQIKDAVPVIIDTEAYRARRRQQLERMALSMGERAKREHRPVSLDPMPPRDRRIIHLTLKDDPLVITRSSGSGYLRALEIAPVEDRRPRDERPTQERERERPRDREPLGQQGGFKHGQKRIV
jgi:spoIIIJ-associated protein